MFLHEFLVFTSCCLVTKLEFHFSSTSGRRERENSITHSGCHTHKIAHSNTHTHAHKRKTLRHLRIVIFCGCWMAEFYRRVAPTLPSVILNQVDDFFLLLYKCHGNEYIFNCPLSGFIRWKVICGVLCSAWQQTKRQFSYLRRVEAVFASAK